MSLKPFPKCKYISLCCRYLLRLYVDNHNNRVSGTYGCLVLSKGSKLRQFLACGKVVIFWTSIGYGWKFKKVIAVSGDAWLSTEESVR